MTNYPPHTLLKDTGMDINLVSALARAGIKPTVEGLDTFVRMRDTHKVYYQRTMRKVRAYLKAIKRAPINRQGKLF